MINKIIDEHPPGRELPKAIDVESVILGAMLLEREGVDIALEVIGEKRIFYLEKHQVLFDAIKKLSEYSNPIDIITVTDELISSGNLKKAGGRVGVISHTTKVNSSSNIEFHLRIILERYLKRKIIGSANLLLKNGYDKTVDAFVALDFAFSEIHTLTNGLERNAMVSVGSMLMDSIQHTEKAANGTSVGVPSGFDSLDEITGGWIEGNMIVIAARPSMGKTAIALNFALNAANLYKQPVAVFSLEMTKIEVTQRLQSMATGIPLNKLSRGHGVVDEDWNKISEASSVKLSDSPIYIDDTAGLNILQLRIKVKRAVRNYGIKLIIIDYLQLMNGKGSNREQEISKISRGVKELAKEVNCPIIILSQLSRAVELRGGDHRPRLSDLRESGSIEQDADLVIFPYRPEYYGIENDAAGNDLRGTAEIIVKKNRSGNLGSAFLKWESYIQKFTSYANIS